MRRPGNGIEHVLRAFDGHIDDLLLRVGSRQDYGCGGVDQRIATLECGIEAPCFEQVCLETL
jgi:hypothetical protein